jgi:exopolyphosphatase/guanosine-5'-triphosphate,3'-diphosphate pyrophosphatase
MARTRGKTTGRSNEVNQVELPTGQVVELAAQLAALDLRERLALPGMPSRRAPMLPIGATILETIAVKLGVDHFVVSEWGLREGALLDAITHRSDR